MPTLQFQPLASQPTPAFWTALTSHKLDKAQLNDNEQRITGWLEAGRTVEDHRGQSSSTAQRGIGIDGGISVGGDAFGEALESHPVGSIPVTGILKNFNTIEEFRKNENKKELFNRVVTLITESFQSEEPILNPFLLVTFADLKKYTYHYWFAFPAIVAKTPWTIDDTGLTSLHETDVQEIRQLATQMEDGEGRHLDAFLVKGQQGARSIAPLSAYKSFVQDVSQDQISIAFHDPSSSKNPGWPLRNTLHYLNSVHGMTEASIICLREGNASQQGHISLPSSQSSESGGEPVAVGWERTKDGKLASRIVDLGPMMDPTRLAEQAVDLNLKLMKWRIAPTLDLELISRTKCLLLGAGTLGCYVARNLMAWGVRIVTFVDSGKVSYSNPIRQPLFRFEDCLNEGQPKALCAAERLREIFPGVISTGHAFTIPMPGHPVPPSQQSSTTNDVQQLEALIDQHDAIFLLMDSRESRWLPTLIGMDKGKIVINAALGFDTYLVMRHGVTANGNGDKQLGCYYCNDVVAPTDSLTDRTLDQMCTVTRPGIAPLAAACATELLVTLLQHPLGSHAPPYEPNVINNSSQDSALGEVPHQIRGHLSQWRNMVVHGPAYDQCTACSSHVLDAYRQGGIEWLFKVFSQAEILEQVTGLDKLHAEGEKVLENIDWSDDSEDDM